VQSLPEAGVVNIVRFWRSHRLLIVIFLVALSLTGFFFVRTVLFTLHWADPAHQEQMIEGWMPLRYVARSWRVPPEVLAEALDVRTGERSRLTVAEIAAERGESVQETAAVLYAAIAHHRSDGDE
jgi:hypothetical protein